MQPKQIIYLLIAVLLSIVAIVALIPRPPQNKDQSSQASPSTQSITDQAVQKALQFYQQQKALGTDFSNGPCLSNDLIPDWVADIAHSPRQDVDNQPDNQCSAFREGRAHHFVELDPDGHLIRAQ